MCLQRAEQKGRYAFSARHSTLVLQVGQSTTATISSGQSEITECQIERYIALEGFGFHVAALRGEAYPEYIFIG